MKRTVLKITLGVATLILLGVIYFVTFTLPVYTYESSDRGMAEIEVPWKGRTLEIVEAQFETYKRSKNNSNLKLYRTCNRIWSAPNLWLDNLTNRRWSIPYMSPSPQSNDNYFEQIREDL